MYDAAYQAECFAKYSSKQEIEEEISYLKNLWSMNHPNPFPKNAHYAYCREMKLREILESKE
jgi:hypothetical protein